MQQQSQDLDKNCVNTALHLFYLPAFLTCTCMYSACATLLNPHFARVVTETLASSVGDLMLLSQRSVAYLLYLGLISIKHLLRSAALRKSPMLPVSEQYIAHHQAWDQQTQSGLHQVQHLAAVKIWRAASTAADKLRRNLYFSSYLCLTGPSRLK